MAAVLEKFEGRGRSGSTVVRGASYFFIFFFGSRHQAVSVPPNFIDGMPDVSPRSIKSAEPSP